MALPSFSEYVVPGVYWESTPTPTSTLAPVTSSVIALVGPGIGYRTFTESVTLISTTSVNLSQLGINLDSVVVTSLDGTTFYNPSSDYTLAATAATDGHAVDTTTAISRQSGSSFASGTTVQVSYKYTDYGYSQPSICSNLQDVQTLYGVGINTTTGEILSPISFAAQFAIANGASTLVLAATPNATVVRADLTDAYALLRPIVEIDLIVPLPVGLTGTQSLPGDVINVAQDLSTFVDNQENLENILQVGLIGYETTVTVNPDDIATSTADERVIEAWPNSMNYFNGYTNSTLVVGGYYLAAAYAGLLAGNPAQQGLTRRTIKNFSGIPSAVFLTQTTAYKNQLSAAGVAVAEISRGGVLWCRHGVTTNPSTLYTTEISLVRAQDFLVELLEGAVEQSGIIGDPIDPNTVVNLQALTLGILESAVTTSLIEAYQNVTAMQLTSAPTMVQVTFEYQPSYPLNFVTFVFSVNTTTGQVSAGTTTGSTS
jgi:hypothetical protein